MLELLLEYRQSLAQLIQIKKTAPEEDMKVLNHMESDLRYAICWLEKGHEPYPRRGIERRAAYQREILMDPHKLKSLCIEAEVKMVPEVSIEVRIEKKLEKLSKLEREVFLMHYCGCLSMKQIAELLGVSKGNIQIKIRRSLAKLRK